MSMNFGPEWMRKAPQPPSSPKKEPDHPEAPQKSKWAAGRPNFNKPPLNSPDKSTPTATTSAKATTSFSDVAARSNVKSSPLTSPAKPSPTTTIRKYVYSRETMLDLFDENLEPPQDFDKTLLAYVDESRQPLAFLPLSDHEKRVFAMSTINSEPQKQRPHQPRHDRQPGERNERHQDRDRQGGHRHNRDNPRHGHGSNNSLSRNDRSHSGSAEWTEGRPSKGESDGDKNPDDLWDTPTAVGSFGTNGVFGFANAPGDLLEKKAPSVTSTPGPNKQSEQEQSVSRVSSPPPKVSPQAQKQAVAPASPSHVQAKATSSPFELPSQNAVGSPSGKLTASSTSQQGISAILGTSPRLDSESLLGRGRGLPSLVGQHEPINSMNAFQEPFLLGGVSSRLQQPLFPLTQPPQQPTPNLFSTHTTGPNSLGGPTLNLPPTVLPGDLLNIQPFKFVSPQWVYRDPSGNIQGPFSSETMHTWYKEGYFSPHLPIKCVTDQIFIPLFQFVEKYGANSPFLEFLVEREQIEKMHYLQTVQQQQIRMTPPLGSGVPSGFLHAVPGFQKPGLPAFGGMNTSLLGGAGLASTGMALNPSLVNPNPVADLLPRKVDPEALIATSSVLSEPPSSAQSDQPRSPAKETLSPSLSQKSTGLSSVKSPAVEVVVNQLKDLSIEKENTWEQEEKSPAADGWEISEKTTKKEKKGKKGKASAPVEPQPEHSEGWETTPVEADQGEKDSSPVIATPPAPWLNKEPKQSSKLTLREIQDMEAQRAAKLEKERQLKAQEALKLEAARLAQAEASANQSILSQSSWGANSTGVPGKSKTLAQIMEDEAKSKQTAQQQAKATGQTGVKRYSDKVGPSTRPVGFAAAAASGTTLSSGITSAAGGWGTRAPAVVATGPLLKPALVSNIQPNHDAGWQTAGKNGSKPSVKPPVAPSSTPVVASVPKTTASVAPASKLLIWARTYLKSIQRSGSSPLNVDEFIGILMSFSVKESSTITMICDDTLGGFTAVDPRKFADEFMRRRAQEGLGAAKPVVPVTSTVSASSEPSAKSKAVPSNVSPFGPPDLGAYADDNRFVVVTNAKKKKNKKK